MIEQTNQDKTATAIRYPLSKFLRQKRPRARIQRAFQQWLVEHADEFAIPLQFVWRHDRHVMMMLQGLDAAVWVMLNSWGINVGITWQGEFWDFLISEDIMIRRTPQGYYCKLCETTPQKYFPCREQLWCRHQFDLLLGWVNDDLAQARYIALYGSDGGTWARLTAKNPKQGYVACLEIPPEPRGHNNRPKAVS